MQFKLYIKRTAIQVCPFFLLLLPLLSPAQYTISTQHRALYKDITSLKTKSTLRLFDSCQFENGFDILLHSLCITTEICAEENHVLYQAHKNTLDIEIKRLNTLDQTSTYHKLIKAELYMQWAFTKLYLGDKFNGIYDLKKAFHYLEEIENNNPGFSEHKKSLGLLYILIDLIPEEYQWAPNLIGMNGNIKTGLRYLDESVSQNSFFKNEAFIYKTIIQAYVLHQEIEALNDINKFLKVNSSPLLNYIRSNLYYKNHENDKALQHLKEIKLSTDHCNFTLLQFTLADAYLHRGDYNIASYYYREFLKLHQGKNYLKAAYLKLYFADLMAGKPIDRDEYLALVKNKGQNILEPDSYASGYFKNHSSENIDLLKIRFLSDGGYTDKALNALHKITIQNLPNNEKIEYYYREGRIYQQQSKIEESITSFNACLAITSSELSYFKPNALLQKGYLLEDAKDIDNALECFKKILDFKNYPYEDSIKAKANSKIEELKQK